MMVAIAKGSSNIMANENKTQNLKGINPVDAAQGILDDLKNQARQAEQSGDAFLYGIYNDLIKVASPIVTRAFKRQMREDKAAINRAHLNLKAKAREQKQRDVNSKTTSSNS
jgi:hypothetical protein